MAHGLDSAPETLDPAYEVGVLVVFSGGGLCSYGTAPQLDDRVFYPCCAHGQQVERSDDGSCQVLAAPCLGHKLGNIVASPRTVVRKNTK